MSDSPPSSASQPPARRWLQLLAVVVVLSLAGGGALALIRSKPSGKRRPRDRTAQLVEVRQVEAVRRAVTVEASGTVVPSRSVDLQPEVRGVVIQVGDKLLPGAVLDKGDLVAQLDPRPFQIGVRRAQSGHARAQAQLDIEKSAQQVARREVELFEEENPRSKRPGAAALRKPQLDGAVATVGGAKAEIDQAHLDLARTRVVAPFDALVRQRPVTKGARVTETTTLATLVGVESWWIEVAVPKDQLRWLKLPQNPDEQGSVVRIYDEAAWGPKVWRKGRVLRLGSELVDGGRLAKLWVAVDDPMTRKADEPLPKLLLGSWLRVEIEGRELDAVALPRDLLRNGEQAWVMNEDGRLEIRQLTIGARLRDEVLVLHGLERGERVVGSDLAWPVKGMKLRVAPAKPTPTRESRREAEPHERTQ